jgi:hypothetical protein
MQNESIQKYLTSKNNANLVASWKVRGSVEHIPPAQFDDGVLGKSGQLNMPSTVTKVVYGVFAPVLKSEEVVFTSRKEPASDI